MSCFLSPFQCDSTEPADKISAPLPINGQLCLRNRVFAAPMSGVSDLPFRHLAWQSGAGMVVSEMVASSVLAGQKASLSGRRESLKRLQGEADYAVQLVGREPFLMAEAAKWAEANGALMIDINMGCSARKLAEKSGSAACGAALMRDEALALTIIEAVVAAVSLPVSVKMRLGWDKNSLNAAALAKKAEAAGAQMIIVHARTREQFYQGQADWAHVAAVRAQISVPLIINGDIGSRAEAQQAMALSGADGVMIGRASCGQPWLMGVIAGYQPPANILEYILAHYQAILAHYGLVRGVRHARKHINWYLQKQAAGFYSAAERAELLQTREPLLVEKKITEIFARQTEQDKRSIKIEKR